MRRCARCNGNMYYEPNTGAFIAESPGAWVCMACGEYAWEPSALEQMTSVRIAALREELRGRPGRPKRIRTEPC